MKIIWPYTFLSQEENIAEEEETGEENIVDSTQSQDTDKIVGLMWSS